MTKAPPSTTSIRFPVLQGILRYLFLTKTYTGEIRGKVIWLDGATIEDADVQYCTLVYLGLSGIRIKGRVNIANFTLALAGPAANANAVRRFFAKNGDMTDEQ